MEFSSTEWQLRKLKLELAAFANCARHGHEPKVGGQEAAAALELAIEITRRIESAAK